MSVDIIGTYAPKEATYIVQTASGSLTNEQALSALTTGVMKITNGTGVVSTAVDGTDYISSLVADTTPQLGGNLDLNGNVITGLEIGTDVQAYDADLTTWAGITPAAGIGTFLATPSSANLASAITDETGSGLLVFATSPSLTTPNIGAATGTSLALSGGLGQIGGATGVSLSAALGVATLTGIGNTNNEDLTIDLEGVANTVTLGTTTGVTTLNVNLTNLQVSGTAVLVSGGALGTPSSGTLTNCSGLPLTGITGDAVTALAVGTIELGNASDTTLSRSAAGVLAVEGIVIPSISSTSTLTNKRITPRVSTEASSATPTINTDNVDAHSITALAADVTSFTTNLSGTPTNFDKLTIRIKDNGSARALAWGASFEAKGVALPTTTTASKVTTVGFIYDTVTSKWGCVASVTEA